MQFLKITPKTDKEIETKNLVPDGTYNAEIIKQEYRVSQSNNPGINLTIRLYDANGRERFVFDTLADYRDKTTKEYCYVNGFQKEYEEGMIPAEGHVGKSVRIEVATSDSYTDKNGKKWNAKNVIAQYLPLQATGTTSTDIVDNDIPF